ncbi:MAG TPA: hypothetical protein VK731_14430 [Candidatus Cybelea sp.]|jgi:hypothetical protein|nr:hypothetical protein [Candidatus Cybelea sp.]
MNHRTSRHPCCLHEHTDFLHKTNLARRVTMTDTDNHMATQLGDGKETDNTTNRPESQTNHTLFAAPHAFSVDSHGRLSGAAWISPGPSRKFRHARR